MFSGHEMGREETSCFKYPEFYHATPCLLFVRLRRRGMKTARTILVCDDDPLLVELLEYRLASKGYRVVVARDGGEAFEVARKQRPDAIVLDAMMPVMDGYQVLRRIRAEETLATTPVLMLTARKQERDIVSALELGASEFMVKPFIPEELVARLARLLPGSRD